MLMHKSNWTKRQETYSHMWRIQGIRPFLKGFYGLADNPTNFQERIYKTLEYKQPALRDDMIIVTKGDVKKHEAEVRKTMKKLENAGYRLNPKKWDFFKREIKWVGQKNDQHGTRPLQDKLEAIRKETHRKTERNQNLSWERFNAF